MKIQKSSISMASTHQLETHQSTKKASIEADVSHGGKVKSAVAARHGDQHGAFGE